MQIRYRFPLLTLVVLSLAFSGCKLGMRLPFSGANGEIDGVTDASSWEEHTAGLPFTFGYQAGIERAKAESKPAMIFLTTTWCSWCKKMAHESFQDPEIRELLTTNFVLVLVDGDKENAAKRKLQASGYPYLAFVAPSENVLATQRGYAEPAKLKQVISIAMQAGQSIQ